MNNCFSAHFSFSIVRLFCFIRNIENLFGGVVMSDTFRSNQSKKSKSNQSKSSEDEEAKKIKTETEEVFLLTQLFLDFKKNIASKDNFSRYTKLHDAIRIFIYDYPKKFRRGNYEDLCGDFLLYMDPKISRFILNFCYTGVPVEYYFNYSLKYQFYTFKKRHYKKMNISVAYKDRSIHQALDIPLYTQEPPVSYGEERDAEQIIKSFLYLLDNTANPKVYKKRLWWLVLKHSPQLERSFVKSLSEQLDISTQRFNYLTSKLYSLQQNVRNRKNELEGKRNSNFLGCRLLEIQKNNNTYTESEQIVVEAQIKKQRAQYQKLAKRFGNRDNTISNSNLSKVLRISKGTIDSGIYLLKKNCKRYISLFIDRNTSMYRDDEIRIADIDTFLKAQGH